MNRFIALARALFGKMQAWVLQQDNGLSIESRENALARIRAFRTELPADWKFDREEANRR
jgi:hypothetical protein